MLKIQQDALYDCSRCITLFAHLNTGPLMLFKTCWFSKVLWDTILLRILSAKKLIQSKPLSSSNHGNKTLFERCWWATSHGGHCRHTKLQTYLQWAAREFSELLPIYGTSCKQTADVASTSSVDVPNTACLLLAHKLLHQTLVHHKLQAQKTIMQEHSILIITLCSNISTTLTHIVVRLDLKLYVLLY